MCVCVDMSGEEPGVEQSDDDDDNNNNYNNNKQSVFGPDDLCAVILTGSDSARGSGPVRSSERLDLVMISNFYATYIYISSLK